MLTTVLILIIFLLKDLNLVIKKTYNRVNKNEYKWQKVSASQTSVCKAYKRVDNIE